MVDDLLIRHGLVLDSSVSCSVVPYRCLSSNRVSAPSTNTCPAKKGLGGRSDRAHVSIFHYLRDRIVRTNPATHGSAYIGNAASPWVIRRNHSRPKEERARRCQIYPLLSVQCRRPAVITPERGYGPKNSRQTQCRGGDRGRSLSPDSGEGTHTQRKG